MVQSYNPSPSRLCAVLAVRVAAAILWIGAVAGGPALASALQDPPVDPVCEAAWLSLAAKGASPELAKVAIFPPYIPGNTGIGDVHIYVADLHSAIAKAAAPPAGATVVFDHQEQPKEIPPWHKLWTPGSYSGRPDVQAVVKAAGEVGADFVLMFRLKYSSIKDGNGVFDLHLIDVATGESSQVDTDARTPRPGAKEAVSNIWRHHWDCLQHLEPAKADS